MTMHGDVTELLEQWQRGDEAALGQVLPIVYEELRRVAHVHLHREPVGHVLQTTALVHEAYIRLVNLDRMTFESRTHFFAVAARFMRRILVDIARHDRSLKHGGEVRFVSLDSVVVGGFAPNMDLLVLNTALDELGALDPRLCRVVELRFFVGLTMAETAGALDISRATAERDWAIARAWLHQRLTNADGIRSEPSPSLTP
jgi:RNA polymerase sigma factor (TIGR02999 family)